MFPSAAIDNWLRTVSLPAVPPPRRPTRQSLIASKLSSSNAHLRLGLDWSGNGGKSSRQLSHLKDRQPDRGDEPAAVKCSPHSQLQESSRHCNQPNLSTHPLPVHPRPPHQVDVQLQDLPTQDVPPPLNEDDAHQTLPDQHATQSHLCNAVGPSEASSPLIRPPINPSVTSVNPTVFFIDPLRYLSVTPPGNHDPYKYIPLDDRPTQDVPSSPNRLDVTQTPLVIHAPQRRTSPQSHTPSASAERLRSAVEVIATPVNEDGLMVSMDQEAPVLPAKRPAPTDVETSSSP
ncbi:hypothetical protein CALCODRAFT_513569, partial [Calocera cornea HHB12733]